MSRGTTHRIVAGAAVVVGLGGTAWAQHAARAPATTSAAIQPAVCPGSTDARATAATCAPCHVEIAREWRGSLHAAAWTDPIFQAGYAAEPDPFCRGCHSPAAPAGRDPKGPEADDGISCAVCHVRAGQVLGARARADFAASVYCASCHEFDFPAVAGVPTHEPMQATYTEWAVGSAAARGIECQGCHMPWRRAADGRPYRSHAFAGGHDPALLARSVTVVVRATRPAPGVVAAVATLDAPGVGHAFPTGDLNRRLELRVWLDSVPDGASLEFARSFEPRLEPGPGGAVFVRRESGDTRVPPPGLGAPLVRTLRLRDPRPGAHTLHWALDYLFMPEPVAVSQRLAPERVRTHVLEGAVAIPALPIPEPPSRPKRP